MSFLNPIFNLFSRMSSRERSLVGGAVAVLFGICLYSFVLEPLTSGRGALQTRLQAKERELHTIADLRRRYLELQQKLNAGQSVISKGDPNFTLLTFLESTITQVMPKERINSMNPSSKSFGEYEEQIMEIKLTQVSLQQLVDMLYRIEKGQHPLRVTRLQVKKRTNDVRNFDVVASVSLLRTAGEQPKAPENAPPPA